MNERARVVVVTGASSGVGRATVRRLARRGTSVGLIARGREALDATCREVEALGGRALAYPADVAYPLEVEAAASAIERALGPIEVWINAAAISVFSPVAVTPEEELRRVMEVDYLGTVHGTLCALQRMLPRDHGCIVQIGSALASGPLPLQAAACAAKRAIGGFSDSLRAELADSGSRVRVVEVQLPSMNTPFYERAKARIPGRPRPLPPVYQPEVGAEAIVDAVDDPTATTVRVAPPPRARSAAALVRGQAQAGSQGAGRPHDLWGALPGDHGVRGRFDAEAAPGPPAAIAPARASAVAPAALGAAFAVGVLVAVLRGGRR